MASGFLSINTELSACELARKYNKQLWQVEAIFRTLETALDWRPIFHKRDDTIRGRVFFTFRAVVLRNELERRLASRGWKLGWSDILQCLAHLREIELTVKAKGDRLRTETEDSVAKVFQALGGRAAAGITVFLTATFPAARAAKRGDITRPGHF